MNQSVEEIAKELWDFCDKQFCTCECKSKYGKNVNNCYQSFFYKYPIKQKCCGSHVGSEYCENIVGHYFCRYYTRYASEVYYAFETQSQQLKNFEKFDIISIGCGASPELLGFLNFYQQNKLSQHITYTGIDLNKNWLPINDHFKKIVQEDFIDINHIYHRIEDMSDVLSCNVLLLNYSISHMVQHEYDIQNFFEILYKHIIKHMPEESLIILCDENSPSNREQIDLLKQYLEQQGIIIQENPYYFDKMNNGKRPLYGIKHVSNKVILEKYSSNYGFPTEEEGYNIMGSCTGLQNIMVVK